MPMPTKEGYQSPYVTQFSVFLDNRVGKLHELCEIFDDQALLMVAFSVVDSSDHAVVRLLTTQAPLARKLLKKHSFAFSEAEVLVVGMPTQRTLTPVCTTLLQAELNIAYAYPLLVQPHGHPAIAMETDDQVFAAEILRKHGFTILGEDDLCDSEPPEGDVDLGGSIRPFGN